MSILDEYDMIIQDLKHSGFSDVGSHTELCNICLVEINILVGLHMNVPQMAVYFDEEYSWFLFNVLHKIRNDCVC